MKFEAIDLGLCENDTCWYFRNLDPYKKYKKIKGVNINELLKQSYLYNGIEAYAWNDVVWLSKSSFLTYAGKTDFLGCTIGHELSHIVFNDHIKQSIKLSESLKKLTDKNQDVILIESEKINELHSYSEILSIFQLVSLLLLILSKILKMIFSC